MASVDPKELAQRNIPLIVLYAVALAAIPAYLVVVQGGIVGDRKTKNTVNHATAQLTTKKKTISALANRIKAKDPNDPVYNENYTKYFDERAKHLNKQSATLGDLVRAKDEKLEAWFDKFNGLGADAEPDFNNFKQHWNSSAFPALVEEYKDIVSDPSDPERSLLHDDEPSDRTKMRFAQKRYWAQKYLLVALSSAEHKIELVRGTKIAARLQDRILVSEPRGAGDAGRDKPKPLVTSFKVNLKFLCSFRDLGKILREIVAQPIPMRIQAFEVAKEAFRVEERDINLLVDGSEKVFTEDHTQILLEDVAAQFKGEDKLEEYVPEPPVSVSLEVEILDFNPPAPKKIEEEAPPAEEASPPAEEPQGEGDKTEGEKTEEGK